MTNDVNFSVLYEIWYFLFYFMDITSYIIYLAGKSNIYFIMHLLTTTYTHNLLSSWKISKRFQGSMNSPIKKDKMNLSHPLRTEPFPVDPFTMSRMCYQSILTYLTNDGLIVSYTPTSLVSETCKMFLQYLPLTKK